jgi:ankyrin repeat protein
MNPVFNAITGNRPYELKLLLALGHNPYEVNSHRYTPLELSVRYKYKECIKVLLEAGVDPSKIILAKYRSNIGDVELLFRMGADPNAINHSCSYTINFRRQANLSPLHILAYYNQLYHLEMFLSFGADPNVRSPKGYTPVFYAVEGKSHEALEALIKYGGSLTETIGKGVSVLHHAARHNATECIRILLAHGMDKKGKDYRNRTPLWYALKYNAHQAAELL